MAGGGKGVALAHRQRLLEGELDAFSGCAKGLFGVFVDVIVLQAVDTKGGRGSAYVHKCSWG